MRALAPVLAALIAAAGCTVSTSQFKPRTDDECAAQAAGTKACGNRCVPADDPSTGCATAGDCQPCPAPVEANMRAACVSGACGAACTAGFADCDGSSANGCEIRIDGADAAHCGDCTHSCTTGYCSGGVCSATEVLSYPGALPRAMTRDLVDGTILFSLIDPAAIATTTGVTSRVCTLAGACVALQGKATALASVNKTWWAGLASGADLAVVETPADGPAVVTTVATASDVGDEIDSLLVTSQSSRAIYTTSGPHQDPSGPLSHLHVLVPGSGARGVSVAASEGVPRGIGGLDPWYYVGTPDAGGTVFLLTDGGPGASTLAASVALTGAATPTRIVGWSDGLGGGFLFWASQEDGSVWRAALWMPNGSLGTPERIAAPTGPTAYMQLASDADGVYWCNRGTGYVWRWRASDGAVFRVGFSGSPVDLATDASRVYWTDDTDRKVYRGWK